MSALKNLIPSAPNGANLKLFRPSSAPALELCSHFESMVTPSPNKVRGTNCHTVIAQIMERLAAGAEITPEMAGSFSSQCDWALQTQAKLIEKIWGIEEEVTLYQEGEFITSGTLDLWGRTDGRLQIIDWKTGQERPYGAQLAIYGVALMEQTGDTQIGLHTAFVDQERVFSQTCTLNELRERVDSLVEAVRDPASGYYINAYCSYCDCRDSCPAWAAERNLVAGLDGSASLGEKFSVLKSDPEKLGRFVVAWRRLKNMVEKVEELDKVALGMIQSGATLPGLTTIKRKGKESIGAADLYELIESVERRELDEFLKVDTKTARALWDKYMNKGPLGVKVPFPKTEISKPSEYLALKK